MRTFVPTATYTGVIVFILGTSPLLGAPNILLILADDQSWNGTSVQMDPNIPGSKSDYYQTPRLEALAAQGMRFSNAYSAAPLCSPTRAALVTGRSPAQVHMTDIITPGLARAHDGLPLTPPIWSSLDSGQQTLPRRVKAADPSYFVGHVGKWHLSPNPYPMGYQWSNPVDVVAPDDPAGIFGFTKVATDFLDARAANNEPFFLQVSYFAVHTPVTARPETIAKYQNLPPGSVHTDPVYAAFTEDFDTGVGMLLDRLEQLGLAEDTYVVYASDNGASAGVSRNSPLYSGKNNLWEGGIRVPLIISGPGISDGTVSHVPTTTTDLYATISELAGNHTPLPKGVEGASLAPILFNGGMLPDGQEYLERQYAKNGALFFHSPHYNDPYDTNRSVPSSAVRLGDFKLVLEYGARGAADKVYLFNLANSLTESNQLDSPLNLANQLPEKRDEMLAMLRGWLSDTDANQAYDVSAPVHLDWYADRPGQDSRVWRSPTNVDYHYAESWSVAGLGTERVVLSQKRMALSIPSQRAV